MTFDSMKKECFAFSLNADQACMWTESDTFWKQNQSAGYFVTGNQPIPGEKKIQ